MNADNNAAYLTHTLGYSYDPQDRITQVSKDGTATEADAHDANSNVISQTLNGTATAFNYDRNRLLTAVTGGVTTGYTNVPLEPEAPTATTGPPARRDAH